MASRIGATSDLLELEVLALGGEVGLRWQHPTELDRLARLRIARALLDRDPSVATGPLPIADNILGLGGGFANRYATFGVELFVARSYVTSLLGLAAIALSGPH